MGGFEIWLIALSLAMDCFAVSIAVGIILKKNHWGVMFRTSLAFGLFQMIMPLLGWWGTHYFKALIENFDHWIAFGLLAFLGVRMIIESFKKKEDRTLDPTKWKMTLTFAIATSIDAIAVGISFACVGLGNCASNIWTASAIIGIVAFIVSWIGLFIGILGDNKVADRLHAEFWGGLILIGIGVKVLYQHLCA